MLPSAIHRFAASTSRRASASGRPFNVLMIGAGPVNFGTPEGPWDHAKRLEKHLGQRLNVVGIVERDPSRAERVLSIKRANASIKGGYEKTKIFSSIQEAGGALQGPDAPQLAVLGIQAFARGTTLPGRDTELQLVHEIPKIGLLVEKPISAVDADNFGEVERVAKALKEKGTISSVGYMLRYLKASRAMRNLIQENNLNVMATFARFLMAYKFAGAAGDDVDGPRPYWDLNGELGPIVGQGTHLVDLVRFMAPKLAADSLNVNTIEPTDSAGFLSELKFNEKGLVKPEERIPRMTNATWRYENGGLGSFLHGVVLHEGDYECEVMILADGWLLRLTDPYGSNPTLHVRKPGTTAETATVFSNDDCYLSEAAAIVDAIEGTGPKDAILSSYEDALESYKMTWAIRLAGEAAAKARGVKPAING